MKENNKPVSLETMAGAGKRKQIAGREYMILPVNVMDMKFIMGKESEEERLIILDRKELEKEDGSANWQLFGLNITDERKKETFMYILNKYVYYCLNDEKIPMTEELLIEHNWSFKEIGEFLFAWCQISD